MTGPDIGGRHCISLSRAFAYELSCFQYLTGIFRGRLCYDAAMLRVAAALLALSAGSVFAQTPREELVRARQFYNDRKFDEAIAAADLARKTPETADAAGVV